MNKKQYQDVRRILGCQAQDSDVRQTLVELLDEYESAHPQPPEIKCPACGEPMSKTNRDDWCCLSALCGLLGPRNDSNGKKVLALGRKKLPLAPPFVVLGSEAFPMLADRCPKAGDRYLRCCTALSTPYSLSGPAMTILGDPIDVSAWLE